MEDCMIIKVPERPKTAVEGPMAGTRDGLLCTELRLPTPWLRSNSQEPTANWRAANTRCDIEIGRASQVLESGGSAPNGNLNDSFGMFF